ncbi:putative choline transporter, neither null mutation nor overexpression affects choline transport [Actinomortierella ambigua]|nr:putative choline transporter, neither null mutation nor overexpression affects choline transport [Actinomortierella ambigua]
MADKDHLLENSRFIQQQLKQQQQQQLQQQQQQQSQQQQQNPEPYGAHPQPTYQPDQLQGRWGHNQGIQQYPHSGPLPSSTQAPWAPSPQLHSLPLPPPSGYPEHELAPIGHQAPPYNASTPESQKPEKFKQAPKYNDLWAMIAFLIQMVGFIVLSGFAISNIAKVLTNIVHCTISGVFATYYFTPGSRATIMSSLKRACTTSFGTICFGALIYAIIQTIKKFITPLVYSEVAIYGKPFIPAARDTFVILKDRGLDVLLNEIIISTVWGIGAFFGSLVAAVGCQYYLMMTMGGEGSIDVREHRLEIWIVTGLIFFLGMQIVFSAGAVIHSGIATILIALAEDPDALARTKPEFFARIEAVYPDIVRSIHR